MLASVIYYRRAFIRPLLLIKKMVRGTFNHEFLGHWLKMAPAGLGGGQKTVLGDGRR